mmetsp:Transcript_40749/g.45934  ORF Transcript_40749/g.45934 Transcript_40749/m.45934 type:complete len:875 (+) Transcript_40749:155-2779(+)
MMRLLRSVVILWLVYYTNAFQSHRIHISTILPTASSNNAPHAFDEAPTCTSIFRTMHQLSDDLDDSESCVENEESLAAPRNHRRGQFRKQLVYKIKMSLAFLSPIAMVSSSVALVVTPQKANAGAPVMAMPKMKTQDPSQVAFDRHERTLMEEAQKELSYFQSRAREIEKEKGPAARDQFEKEYAESQKAKAEAFKEGLVELKRNLLNDGIDPFQDIEGRRQVIFYQRGVDLGEVDGTQFNVEKRYEEQGSEQSFSFRKKANREMIKAMVQDLKNRDIDTVKYFERNQEKTDMVLHLSVDKAAVLATKYNQNLEMYGQIAPPKEGEKSVKELMAEKGQNQNQKGNKDEKKRMKAEAKEKASIEKAEKKGKAKAEKERLKEEKRAAKKAAKKLKEPVVAAVAAAVSTPTDVVGVLDTSAQPLTDGDSLDPVIDNVVADESAAPPTDYESTSVSQIKKSGGIKIVPAAAVVVSVGGGAYTLKMVRDRSAAEEAERQRQFKLLMGEVEGGVSETSTDSGDSAGNTLSDLMYEYENLTEDNDDDDVKSPEPIKSPIPKPKKRRGLKSVFRKNNNNDREIDIAVLIAPEAKASEFSQTLAKILTFGAPGRFPKLTKLPGDMPMEAFDLDKASNILMEAQDSARITKEESAEIFANVVNCMLIDIVDLASTSLKEKDETVTTDALGIVITFMDLAAQLYTSIADGVDIVPVTYGGDISKKKLEKMYSTYAVSGMMDMSSIDEKFDDRVSLLQDVFQISPKKAEGLMTKAMQKNMMEMMKSGEMPDGMEDMMKGMDGMGGLPGMEGGEEPNPEQLKEMLRALKDLKSSGSVPESEINEVKKQFKEAFGSSIDELMKNASDGGEELGEVDQELLDLMKSILD